MAVLLSTTRVVGAFSGRWGTFPAVAEGPWYDPLNSIGLSNIYAFEGENAASLAASLVNLAQPGVSDLTQIDGTVTWANGTGWSWAGGTNEPRLETGLRYNTDVFSFFVQFDIDGSGRPPAGCFETTTYSIAVLNDSSSAPGAGSHSYRDGVSGTQLALEGEMRSGNLGIAGRHGYKDGVDDGAMPGSPYSFTETIKVGGTALFGNTYNIDGAVKRIVLYATDVSAVAGEIAARMAAE